MKDIIITIMGTILGFCSGYIYASKKVYREAERRVQEVINIMIKEHVWRMKSENYTKEEENKFVAEVSRKSGHKFEKRLKKE
jgi:glutamine amidotransferase PdxT